MGFQGTFTRRFGALVLLVAATALYGWVASTAAAGRHRQHKRATRYQRGVRQFRGVRGHSGGRVASGCGGARMAPSSANLDAYRMALLCLINQRRTGRGLAQLALNPQLTAAAQHHSGEMVADGYFGHTSPSGETPAARVFGSGYTGPRRTYELGENIAWGAGARQASPAAIVAAWMASPPHRANILARFFHDTGFGIMPSVPGGFGRGLARVTVTEEFGARSAG